MQSNSCGYTIPINACGKARGSPNKSFAVERDEKNQSLTFTLVVSVRVLEKIVLFTHLQKYN